MREDSPTLIDEDLPPPVSVDPTRRRRRRGPAVLALVVIVAAVGFLVWRALGTATVYFRTADEAIAERAELGTRRFRIEGVVQTGTIRQEADVLRFVIYGDRGAQVPVIHRGGQPTGLFRENIPVVLEGRWGSGVDEGSFASDRVIVKHSESYRADNPDRVRDYAPSK